MDVDEMQALDDYHSTNGNTNNSVGITAASLNCGYGRFKYKIVRSAQSSDPHLAASATQFTYNTHAGLWDICTTPCLVF